MKFPYPIKDWHDASQYEDISSFAWEFLRRNPEYQRDYYYFHHDVSGFTEYFFKPVKPPNEVDYMVLDYIELFSGDHHGYHYIPLGVLLLKKYGLKLPPLIDPLATGNPVLIFDCKDSLSTRFYSDNKYNIPPLEPQSKQQIAFCFNATDIESVDLQLEMARVLLYGQLVDKPQKQSRFHKSKMVHYLRVLDARAAGVELCDIASVLIPHKQNTYPDWSATKEIRNWLHAGKHYAEHGYWAVAIRDKAEELKKTTMKHLRNNNSRRTK